MPIAARSRYAEYLRAWVLIFASVGCGDNYGVTLSELAVSRLSVYVPALGAHGYGVGLQVSPERDRCPIVDPADLAATVGGVALTFSGITFVEGRELSDPYDRCELSFHSGDDAVPENDVVTVSDSTKAVSARFLYRSLQRRSAWHPTWFFQRGETVSIYWSHPDDFDGTAFEPQVSLSPSGEMSIHADVVRQEGTVSFVVPTTFPVGLKEARLEVLSNYYADVALQCVNAVECVVHQERQFVHDAGVY